MPIIVDLLPPTPPAPTPDTDSISPYTGLITSEHNRKPKFMATVGVLLTPVADVIAVIRSLPSEFDLDLAVGTQLDVVGLWVGQSREIPVELPNVYFSLDVEGLGLDEGSLIGPDDATTGLSSLPDDSYRMLLRSKIAQNHWDGTVSQAISITDLIFADTGLRFVLQDGGDMTMTLGLIGSGDNAVVRALFNAGFFDLKPAGVRLDRMISVDGPLFGLDVENDVIAGLDVGAFSSI